METTACDGEPLAKLALREKRCRTHSCRHGIRIEDGAGFRDHARQTARHPERKPKNGSNVNCECRSLLHIAYARELPKTLFDYSGLLKHQLCNCHTTHSSRNSQDMVDFPSSCIAKTLIPPEKHPSVRHVVFDKWPSLSLHIVLW